MVPAPPPPAKKSNVLLWILIGVGGCFALIVVVLLAGGLFVAHKMRQAGVDPDLMKRNPALAATKIMTAMNPNIAFVSLDEGRQEIVVRERKTGKTYTVTFDDAKKGRFQVKSDEGSFQVGGDAKVPTWLPDYPGSNPQTAYAAQGNDGPNGTFMFKTKDSAEHVAKYYRDQLEGSGLTITATVDAGSGQIITAEDKVKRHTATVVVGAEGGETTVNVTYSTNK